MPLISIIVPCYNEQEVLPHYFEAVQPVLEKMQQAYAVEFEFVMVNDGSRDATLSILKEQNRKDERYKYVSLSRNFGKEAGMLAGMEKAKGDFVVVMDADLQDPPSMMEEMYKGVSQNGYDCVGCRRVSRKGEPIIRSFFARAFYRSINKISQTEIVDGARDYRMMNRVMVDAILSVREYNRFSKGIFSWVGFDTHWLEYVNVERVAGETKWSFWKLLRYSIDGITSFSTAPLRFAAITGLLVFMAAVFVIIFVIARYLLFGDPVQGWASTVCILLGVSGVQLFSIGVLGEYLSKTYMEVKRRPLYLVKEESEGLQKQ